MKHLKRALTLLDSIQSHSFKALLRKAWNEADFLFDFLEREYRIKPLIVGGLAVQLHGYSRFTEDIDILLSTEDYSTLLEDEKIKFGQLKIKPGVQIDVLAEGKDGNPNPEQVRDGESYYPTFEGLVYLKLISNRLKDRADIVELFKAKGLDEAYYSGTKVFLPKEMQEDLDTLWEEAKKEKDNVY